MFRYMRRREFIALFGGVVAWPRVVRAQKPAMPVIGFLGSGSPELFMDQLTKFRVGLSDTGYTEGQNVRIEYRWAQGRFDRLPELAADLVGLQLPLLGLHAFHRSATPLDTQLLAHSFRHPLGQRQLHPDNGRSSVGAFDSTEALA
jgi:hypothetical protein